MGAEAELTSRPWPGVCPHPLFDSGWPWECKVLISDPTRPACLAVFAVLPPGIPVCPCRVSARTSPSPSPRPQSSLKNTPTPPPLYCFSRATCPSSLPFHMSSMNSRLKAFGFGKRKSTASIHGGPDPPQTSTPPPQIPQQFPTGPGPAPSIASNSSQQSLPMNHPGPGPRPPSYTANFPPQGGPQAPLGRTSPLTGQGPTRTPPSQMIGGPPPINTGAPVAGYPPPMQIPGGPPPVPGGPPGYGGGAGYPPPAPPQQGQPMPTAPFRGNPAAEVEGNSRSKAQLIVGIDFVSRPSPRRGRVSALRCLVANRYRL